MKPKKCKVCKEEFTPVRPLQMVCSAMCATKYQQNQQEKKKREWRKRKKEMREELMTLTDWKKKLEREVNGIVRILDKGVACISCTGKVEQAGHYHSVGSNDTLRFNLHNIHGQCIHCNMHKGSNLHGYDEGLIERYGKTYWNKVKFDLVKSYPLVKFTVPEVREAIDKAREIRKGLEKSDMVLTNRLRKQMREKLNNQIGLY